MSYPQINVLSRLIEGAYPNYQDIIPKKFVANLTINKDELVSQIKKAGLFSGRSSEVRLEITPKDGKLKVFSQTIETGKNEATLPCRAEGIAVKISFNYKFLLDGLNSVKGAEVTLELSENEGPCILRPVGDNSFLYVLMPIKL